MRNHSSFSFYRPECWVVAFVLFSFSLHAQKPTPPRAGYHRAAAEFRSMQMRDEFGIIPENALLRAVAQKSKMSVDPRVWPGNDLDSSQIPTPQVAGLSTNAWTWLGPGNIGGRVRLIIVHPTTPTTMWAGSV